MTSVTTKAAPSQPQSDTAVHLFDNWIDPIETEIRGRIRGFIEELIRSELETALARPRYGRRAKSSDDADSAAGAAGHRHGSRTRTLMGSFGKVEIKVPRARLQASDGKTTEWRSSALRAYQRRTLAADALIASAYLAGQTVLPSAETAAMLFWALLASGQINMRKVDGWQTLATKLGGQPIDLAA